MRIVGTATLLIILGVFLPVHSAAEVWHCPQHNGPDLFTNLPADGMGCEKYIPGRDVNDLPSVSIEDSESQFPGIVSPYTRDGATGESYMVPDDDSYAASPSYSSPSFYPYYGARFFRFHRIPHAGLMPPHIPGRSFRRR
jgi:hypothetical protein